MDIGHRGINWALVIGYWILGILLSAMTCIFNESANLTTTPNRYESALQSANTN